jgi:4-hydroxy-3-methylbut-2-enyl diphosphate reductase IspH
VQTSADLKPDWFVDATTVGITAGTSTPDDVIDGVEAWLKELVEFQDRLAEHIHSAPQLAVATPS